MGVHPAARCLGCLLGGESVLASLETMYVAPFIAAARKLGNNAKELGFAFYRNSFTFSALIGFSGVQVLELVAPPARPFHRRPLDLVAFPDAKRHRQFRLRKV